MLAFRYDHEAIANDGVDSFRHGAAVMCKIDDLKKIVEQYKSADEATRRFMEIRYGAKNLAKLVREAEDEILTNHWIQSNTQPCPNCDTPIEKSVGCNHMRCRRCDTHFCYLCGQWIDPSDPYLHFNNPRSPCDQRLFDGLNLDDVPDAALDAALIDALDEALDEALGDAL
jgi:E3 ubiquitin-protein ligase RNF14